MPVWPKSLITLGASVLTAQAAMRLRTRDRGVRPQRKAFRSLMANLSSASFWRDAGVRAGMSYEEFRAGVEPRSHTSLLSAVDRMRDGESDVLWPGPCHLFVSTSGTTQGTSKLLPVTGAMLEHYRAALRDALLFYTARVGHAGVFRGRRLILSGDTQLRAMHGAGAAHRAYVGDWSAVASLGLPGWAQAAGVDGQAEAGSGASDWESRVGALIEAAAALDVSFVAGVPQWLLGFSEATRRRCAELGRAVENLRQCWPNLECVVHGGCSAAPYLAELGASLGSGVMLHEVYAAAEGVFGAQDTAAKGELRVMANRGIFFEFVPLADFDGLRVESLGSKAVPLADVRVGVDYAVLLTTPAGLARFVLGDIVRFTSVEPPRLIVVGRTELLLSAFGERVLEKELTDALLAVCQRHRWSIVNFHVAPLLAARLTGQSRGRHEWWVELKPGTMETPTGPQMAVELDVELQRLNREYLSRRAGGRIDAPTVRLVMPGVFRHWQQFHGRWDGQNRVARCRGDRLVADELAQMTRFAGDQP